MLENCLPICFNLTQLKFYDHRFIASLFANEHQIINATRIIQYASLHLLPLVSYCVVKDNLILYLQSDILLCMLLSVITFGMVAISMLAMFYLTSSPSYIEQQPRSDIGRYWTETSIGVFLGIVVKMNNPYPPLSSLFRTF
jgi:hypothetical protein